MPRLMTITAFAICLVAHIAVAAASCPTSDPQALSLAAQALSAMTGGNAITDVTLPCDVAWFAGSNVETATMSLSAKGKESRVDLQLDSETRTDIRNAGARTQGGWIGTYGVFAGREVSALHQLASAAPTTLLGSVYPSISWVFIPIEVSRS